MDAPRRFIQKYILKDPPQLALIFVVIVIITIVSVLLGICVC